MRRQRLLAFAAILATAVLFPSRARAHCDGLDGPVVSAARESLKTGDVTQALVWIQPGDEPELRQAFARTIAVRALGSEARELADLYFFETLVRLHRAGEGEPFTGLKPAGRDLGPAIPAADEALRTGRVAPLLALLADAVKDGTRASFDRAAALAGQRKKDVAAGRRYVAAYVAFVHQVEAIHAAATRAAHDGGHADEH